MPSGIHTRTLDLTIKSLTSHGDLRSSSALRWKKDAPHCARYKLSLGKYCER